MWLTTSILLLKWAPTGYTINSTIKYVCTCSRTSAYKGWSGFAKTFIRNNDSLVAYYWFSNSLEVLMGGSQAMRHPSYKVALLSVWQRQFVCVRVGVRYRATRLSGMNAVRKSCHHTSFTVAAVETCARGTPCCAIAIIHVLALRKQCLGIGANCTVRKYEMNNWFGGEVRTMVYSTILL